jgi:4-amino-4-deoxy-L-arabinose transferase-like glycosyltransferase
MKLDFLKTHIHIRELILFSLALHLLAIGFPSDGKVFDEAFYIPAANDILKGVASNPEHPFLGKLWGSIGIAIFGDNWFGWRIPMVAFGMLTLYVFYHLARLFLDETKALMATAFLSFDTIFFIHSSLLLLEVPCLFFGILGFYLYFKDRYILSAAAFGMSILSKEWGVMFVIALLVYHMIGRRPITKGSRVTPQMLAKTGKFVGVLAAVVIIPLWAFASAYTVNTDAEVQVQVVVSVDAQGTPVGTTTTSTTVYKSKINSFAEQVNYMLTYQSKLTIKPDSKVDFWNNYPWGWITPHDVKPPIYYEKNVKKETVTRAGDVVIKTEVTEEPLISWKGIGNMPIWLSIWVVGPYAAINIARRKAGKLDYLIIAWIVGTYLPWFYVSGVVERIVYAFYFINVVPILALGIPHFVTGVTKGRRDTLITAIWLAISIIFFFLYYPVNVFNF